MNDKKIAVVIVTFNRSSMLAQNLASLNQQGDLYFFIIDNNSQDNTEAIVKDFISQTTNPVCYINTKENLGGAGGFALGCKLALEHSQHFTHLWLSDDDVTFQPECLQNLVPFLDSKTLLQPMRYSPEGKNAEASSVKIDLESVFILNHKRETVMDTDLQYQTTPFSLDNIPFEGVMIPRSVFNKIGIPDKRFFIFGDDLDFCLKAKKLGFRILCIPASKMTRLKCVRADKIPKNWKSYFVYRNFFYIQRHYGENSFVKNKPYLIALGVSLICLLSFNYYGVKVMKDALLDGLHPNFPLNKNYIP